MKKKISIILASLVLTTTVIYAKGQAPDDLFEKGMSLEPPGIYAKVNTDKGLMIFSLDYQNAPLTTLNFINLAENGFYDGLLFYRSIDNYAVFSGDPSNSGTSQGAESFPMEEGLLNPDSFGVLCMDGISGQSNGSRFFIMKTPDRQLEGKYTVFGTLLEGSKVLSKIRRNSEIHSIEIIKNGSEALSFKTDESEFNRLSSLIMEKQLESFAQDFPEVAAAISALGNGVQKSMTGIYFVISKEGNGLYPQEGDTVSVHYNAMLIDRTIFDSSLSRGVPFEFQVGQQAVIPGWDESLMSMSIGEKRTVIIPPYLAYGDIQAGPIAPNSWLIFEIELLGIK